MTVQGTRSGQVGRGITAHGNKNAETWVSSDLENAPNLAGVMRGYVAKVLVGCWDAEGCVDSE